MFSFFRLRSVFLYLLLWVKDLAIVTLNIGFCAKHTHIRYSQVWKSPSSPLRRGPSASGSNAWGRAATLTTTGPLGTTEATTPGNSADALPAVTVAPTTSVIRRLYWGRRHQINFAIFLDDVGS